RDADSAVPTTGGDKDGATCIPPRRRRLYVGKLEEWAKSQSKTQTSGSETSEPPSEASSPSGKESSQSDKLRDAFIESAAVETFFLWDRYKEEKKREEKERKEREREFALLLNQEEPSTEEDPQIKLNDGTIPEEFKRQMFYTLGDYRDICIGKTPHGIDTVSASGDNPTNKVTMKKISENIKKAIEQILPKNGTPPGQKSENPESWWQKNGEHIWNGMVCALTYKNSGDKKIEQVKTANDGNLFDELKKKYEYGIVKLGEEEASGAMHTTQNPTSGEKTYLSKFVLRPPYFRYLEEWGENFCKERKKRLAQIKKDCKVGEGARGTKNPKCSCYGEHCDDQLDDNPSTIPSLKCPGCGIECRKYKKWIERKKIEFTQQSNAFTEQKKKCVNGSNNHGNEFCGTPETTCDTAKEFLQKLGSCSKINNENNIGEGNKKIFEDDAKTFGPADNCKPCSKFKIDCEKANCTVDEKTVKCNGKNKNSIDAKDIGNGGNSAEDVSMHVSDNDTNTFEGDALEACQNADIFKGIREDVWTCGNVCGYNVCKPKNVNGEKGNGNEIIIIRALFKRWLEYFLQDYNKIKTTLIPCMKNGQGSTCIKDYDKKHTCVEQWIEKKKTEWEKIKEHYLEKNENIDDGMTSLVRNFLEELQHLTEFQNAIKPCKSLNDFESFCGLNGAEISQKKESEENDLVLCMIKKLEEKATSCKEKHQNSGNPQQPCEESSPEPDDEPFEEEENPENIVPKICEDVVKKPETKDQTDGGCEKVEPPAVFPDSIAPENGETETIVNGPDEEKKDEEGKEKEASEPSEASRPTATDSSSPPTPATPGPTTPKKTQPPQPQPTPQLLEKPHVLTAL
ncbi:hypothetical protein PFTANZ_06102, partial [Plasmodium falciparum Tanzania (2000708)]